MEKNGRFKNIVLVVLLIAVLTLSIAYAVLSVSLNITSSATIKGTNSSWKVLFTSASCTASGYAETTASPTVSGTTVSGITATFKAPGDSVTCNITVANQGVIDAKLVSFAAQDSNSTITYVGTSTTKTADETLTNGKIVYSIKYASTEASGYANRAPAADDTLNASTTRDLVLTMTYPSTETSMPTNDVTVTGFKTVFDYEQN